MSRTRVSRFRGVRFVLFFLLTTSLGGQAHSTTCDALFKRAEAGPNLLLSPDLNQPLAYDRFTPEMFEESLTEGLRASRERIAAIKADTRKPNFENTIRRLLAADEAMQLPLSVLVHFKSANRTPEISELVDKWLPENSKFETDVFFDADIFSRVKRVYDGRENLRLSREQKTILEKTYANFVKNGVGLSEAGKKRIEEINDELIALTESFAKNQTDATDSIFLTVRDKSRLRGLSREFVNGAKSLAEKKGDPGAWVFSLQASQFLRVLAVGEDRGLREEIWRLYYDKNAQGGFDNRLHAVKIAQLRREQARILGYPTYAHFATETRMAQSPENVLRFIEKLRVTYRPAAEHDARELQEFAWNNGFPRDQEIKPWDIRYYSEKLKKARYDVDQEQVRPYLPLEAVHQGSLRAAEKLFRIRFEEAKDAPVWHPTVRAYRVFDAKNERFLGFFYFDAYSRKGKRAGAWMTTTVGAGEWGGVETRPHVINELNTEPTSDGTPTLLTVEEKNTVFHELGHGVHSLLSQTRDRSTAGPNVEWDFVEFPSQLNEEWGSDPATLMSFARHYKTGEVIPLELVEKIRRSENFRVATVGLGQLYMSALDMAWYFGDISGVREAGDVRMFEAKLASDYSIYPSQGTVSSAGFGHIFSGGYAAGYYSYKWAEVLVADAFEYFQEKGIFDRLTAARYRREILAKGGSENPSVLYRRFRRQDPDPDALLRREGLSQSPRPHQKRGD